MDTDADVYEGREQSKVKHFVLRGYLQRLTYKIALGTKGPNRSDITLTYVDGFSGPWMSRSPEFRDTSFEIALTELRAAREALVSHGCKLHIRCAFIEKDPKAFNLLERHMSSVTDVEYKLFNRPFEASTSEVLGFVCSGSNSFTFYFIDPSGWSGIEMNALAPLLRKRPCEVLLNFMTKDIKRFVDDKRPGIKASFNELYGTPDIQRHWADLRGLERENAIVELYRQRMKVTWDFPYAAHQVILNPYADKTHFHLLYATRHPKGLCVFREVEGQAMEEQQRIRTAQQQHRHGKAGQGILFTPEELGPDAYMRELIVRSEAEARAVVEQALKTHGRIKYDDLVGIALEMPMTSEKKLKAIISELRGEKVDISGLRPRASVPQLGEGHALIWRNG